MVQLRRGMVKRHMEEKKLSLQDAYLSHPNAAPKNHFLVFFLVVFFVDVKIYQCFHR